MSTAQSSFRTLLTAVTAIGTFMAVLFLPAGLLQAQSGSLFISEYVEGSGSNQAIEIYNPSTYLMSLSASGYMLAFYADGSTGITNGVPLVGTIGPGQTFVVTPTDASAALLAKANQSFGTGWFDGNDAVALLHNGLAVDVIGQIGFDPGTAWVSGGVSTANETLRRKASVTEGDENGSDAFDPALQWDAYGLDNFDGLGWYGAAPATNAAPTATCPAPVTTTQGLEASASVTATDPDGTVTAMSVTGVAPSDPGTFGLDAFAAAAAAGGTASATLTVGADTPVGTWSVTVTASNDDATPQTAGCTVDVAVDPVTPESMTALVDALVTDGGVSASKADLLRDRLARIADAVDAGRTADAAAQLQAFVNQVNGLSPRWVTTDAAATLVSEAELLAANL